MVFRAAALAAVLCGASPAAAGQPRQLLQHPFSAAPSTAAPGSLAQLVKGEMLEYEVYWGVINVGRSYLHVADAVTVSSRTAWHLVSEARSSSFINGFYPVSDRNEAWLDAESLASHGYYKKLSEGKYFLNEWLVFDEPGKKFYGEKMNRKGEVSPLQGELPRAVNDMLSAVFRVRAMPLEPRRTFELPVNTKTNWTMTIKTHGVEKVQTPFGKRKCLLVEPMAGEESLFVAKAGKRMLVWVTQDELRLPLVLKAEIFIGSVTAKLVSRKII